MKPIPLKIRQQLHEDPRMYTCVMNHSCDGKIEWHHPFQRKDFADVVVPLCQKSHKALNRETKQYCELIAMEWYGLDKLRERKPKRDWDKEYEILKQLFNS